MGLGAKLTYTARQGPRADIKLSAAYQLLHFKYSDFTDLRTGTPLCAQRPRAAAVCHGQLLKENASACLVDPCDCGGGNGGGGPACLGGRRRASARGGGQRSCGRGQRPEAPQALDQRVEAVKAEVIRLNRDLLVLEEELLFPPARRWQCSSPWTWARCSSSTRCS